MRFYVLAAASLKIRVFRDMTLCSWVKRSRRLNDHSKLQELFSSKTRHNIPEDFDFRLLLILQISVPGLVSA
jgi:hypothetical protein